MDEEALVEAACLDPAALALDVVVAHVDLRGLREAGELLVGRLGGEDAGLVGAEVLEAHGETVGKQGVELHEAGPGLVEQDVVAEVAEALEDEMGVVDGAVIGALLDDGDAEGAFGLPRVGVGDERVGADGVADAGLVERLVIDRAHHAVGVAVGRQIEGDTAAEEEGAVMGCLVVVSVEQDEVAGRDEGAEHDLVGG